MSKTYIKISDTQWQLALKLHPKKSHSDSRCFNQLAQGLSNKSLMSFFSLHISFRSCPKILYSIWCGYYICLYIFMFKHVSLCNIISHKFYSFKMFWVVRMFCHVVIFKVFLSLTFLLCKCHSWSKPRTSPPSLTAVRWSSHLRRALAIARAKGESHNNLELVFGWVMLKDLGW